MFEVVDRPLTQGPLQCLRSLSEPSQTSLAIAVSFDVGQEVFAQEGIGRGSTPDMSSRLHAAGVESIDGPVTGKDEVLEAPTVPPKPGRRAAFD